MLLNRRLLGVVLVLAISFLGLWGIGRELPVRKAYLVLCQLRPGYLAAVGVVLAILWVAEGLRIRKTVHLLGGELGFRQALGVALATSFVTTITPFGSGGPPLQAYLLSRMGVPLSKGVSVSAIQGILTLGFFIPLMPAAIWLGELTRWNRAVVAGAAIGVLWVLVLSIALAHVLMRPVIVYVIVKSTMGIVFRRWPRRSASGVWARKCFRQARYFSCGLAAVMGGSAWGLAVLGLYTVIIWAAFFIIGPLLLAGLGWEAPWVTIIARQAVLYFVISNVPLPGGSGVAELGAAAAFASLVPSGMLPGFVAVWRFFTFYAHILVGGMAIWWYRHLLSGEPEGLFRKGFKKADKMEGKKGGCKEMQPGVKVKSQQRKEPRYLAKQPVIVEAGAQRMVGWVRNLSEEGVQLVTVNPMKVGEEVLVYLKLKEETVTCRGRTVWLEESELMYRCGIAFLEGDGQMDIRRYLGKL